MESTNINDQSNLNAKRFNALVTLDKTFVVQNLIVSIMGFFFAYGIILISTLFLLYILLKFVFSMKFFNRMEFRQIFGRKCEKKNNAHRALASKNEPERKQEPACTLIEMNNFDGAKINESRSHENEDLKIANVVELKTSYDQFRGKNRSTLSLIENNFVQISAETPLKTNKSALKLTRPKSSSSELSSSANSSASHSESSTFLTNRNDKHIEQVNEHKLAFLMPQNREEQASQKSSFLLSPTTNSYNYNLNTPLSTSTLTSLNSTNVRPVSSTSISLESSDAVTLVSGQEECAAHQNDSRQQTEWSATGTEELKNYGNVYSAHDLSEYEKNYESKVECRHSNRCDMGSNFQENKTNSSSESAWTTRTELRCAHQPKMLQVDSNKDLEATSSSRSDLNHVDSSKLTVKNNDKIEMTTSSSLLSVKELSIMSSIVKLDSASACSENRNLPLDASKSQSNLSVLNSCLTNSAKNNETCLYEGAMIRSIKSDMSASARNNFMRHSIYSNSSSENSEQNLSINRDHFNNNNNNNNNNSSSSSAKLSSNQTSFQTLPSVKSMVEKFEMFKTRTKNVASNRTSLDVSNRASSNLISIVDAFSLKPKSSKIDENEEFVNGSENVNDFKNEINKSSSIRSNIAYFFS